jgi:hypothetical protein
VFLSAAHHCRSIELLSSQAIEGLGSSGQAFTALGAACVDHSTATTGFHANQKAVSACAACFRGLVSAFHFESVIFLGKAGDYRKLSGVGKPLGAWPLNKNDDKPRNFWFMMLCISCFACG